MPSQRRVRLLFLAVVTVVAFMLFYGSGTSSSDGTIEEFYRKTAGALEDADFRAGRRGGHGDPATRLPPAPPDTDRDGDIDDDDERLAQDMAGRLRAAEQKAKEQARQKAPLRPDSPSEVVGVGSSADGQVGKKRLAEKEGDDLSDSPDSEKARDLLNELDVEESEEMHTAEIELNAILKKAPVIIFSKTWCPHSKRAKHILLNKYEMDPVPYVVELDEHPHGAAIQALLAEKTRHSTVPNVLVSGISIGGGDDVAELDDNGTLIEKFEYLAGNRLAVTKTDV
jgi:glutaredoxin